jgi:hypothetical protein
MNQEAHPAVGQRSRTRDSVPRSARSPIVENIWVEAGPVETYKTLPSESTESVRRNVS